MCCAGRNARTLGLALLCVLAACRGDGVRQDAPAPEPAAEPSPEPAPTPEPEPGCSTVSREVLAPGLELLAIPVSREPAVDLGDRCLRVLRADPARYRVAVGSASRNGEDATAAAWGDRLGAVAVTNASMFHSGGASTGLLVDGEVLADRVNAKFGAFFAANPRGTSAASVTMWGKPCPGSLADLRRDYRTVVQNYRLLDCDGSAIRWADPKSYSAAAVGIDRAGRILFLHLRSPYRMATFTELLADTKTGLDLAGAMYVEGGPEATLFVEAGGRREQFVGSYETGFFESDDNARAWRLPNVLALVAR